MADLLKVLDIDHIITCIEVRARPSFKLSSHTSHRSPCRNLVGSSSHRCIRYDKPGRPLLDGTSSNPRGWDGTLCVPTVHAVRSAEQCRQVDIMIAHPLTARHVSSHRGSWSYIVVSQDRLWVDQLRLMSPQVLASQCRKLFLPPTEAVVIDLDAKCGAARLSFLIGQHRFNEIMKCKTPPIGALTPRHRR